tara:strand:- start:747 stop:1931 length:1185 start_codon:yes stop_codon:yes gene_type:complete
MVKINKNSSRVEVLSAVQEDGYALKKAHPKFRDDKKIIMASIKWSPESIEYASDRLKDNKQIAVQVLKLNGNMLKYFGKKIKNNNEIVQIAYRDAGEDVLNHTNKSIRKKLLAEAEIRYQKSKKNAEYRWSKEKKRRQEEEEKKTKVEEKWHLDNKPKLKKSYSHLYSFDFKNFFLMVDMYAGGACFDIKDPIKAQEKKEINFDNIFIGDDQFKFNKTLKTKNGLRFSSGRDMDYQSFLYVNKKGKVKKIFIKITPDLRDLVWENLELIYNDQFVYNLTENEKKIIKSLNINNTFRKKIGEIEITSKFIQIGQRSNEINLEKGVVVNYGAKDIDTLESYILPVKNKKYPIYAYTYYYEDEGEHEENIIIVVEDIEGCYLNKITNKNMYFSNKLS